MSEANSINPTVEYRDIPGHPGYRVGSDGSVWSRRIRIGLGKGNGTRSGIGGEWRLLKIGLDTHGYPRVTLSRPGMKGLRTHNHQLAMLAFYGPTPPGKEICHWDGNPLNTSLSNLRFGTHKENESDRARHGRTTCGEKHWKVKLTADKVREIRAIYAAGGISLRELAKQFGVGLCITGYIIKRKSWAHIE